MRESGLVLYHHRVTQLGDGRGSLRATHTLSLGSSAEALQEDYSSLYLFHGPLVSCVISWLWNAVDDSLLMHRPCSTIIISTMRLISLQELDYADITYNIPHALIFGALEPSVGVTLACIPLLRPLLGRSKYSSNGSVQYNSSYNNPSNMARSGTGGLKGRFAPLDDGSSQYQLQPVGEPLHGAAIIGSDMSGRVSSDVCESNAREQGGGGKGIFVTQQWIVSR